MSHPVLLILLESSSSPTKAPDEYVAPSFRATLSSSPFLFGLTAFLLCLYCPCTYTHLFDSSLSFSLRKQVQKGEGLSWRQEESDNIPLLNVHTANAHAISTPSHHRDSECSATLAFCVYSFPIGTCFLKTLNTTGSPNVSCSTDAVTQTLSQTHQVLLLNPSYRPHTCLAHFCRLSFTITAIAVTGLTQFLLRCCMSLSSRSCWRCRDYWRCCREDSNGKSGDWTWFIDSIVHYRRFLSIHSLWLEAYLSFVGRIDRYFLARLQLPTRNR